MIPYGRHWVDDEDIKAVVDVLKLDWLTQGPKVGEFEKALANRCGVRYAVAFSSGTAALHAAYFSAGLKPGDELITSPITFAATSNAALFLGAKPIFVDVEPDTININPELIESKVTEKTKVIAPIDFAGHSAELDEIKEIARKNNLVVVEDACHALGALFKGQKVGSISDMTVFSFHPVKHITTGEGGAVLTNSEEYYERLLMFRHHGITKDLKKMAGNQGPWFYEMHYLGNNYRLTDFQSALGISQLKKLDGFLKRRREIVGQYNDAFKEIEEIIVPVERDYAKSAWHVYVIRLKLERLKETRKGVFELLRARGLGVQVHYIPVYYHPYYQKLGYQKGICPLAESYYEEAITLPLYPKMSDDEVKRVIDSVIRVIEYAKV